MLDALQATEKKETTEKKEETPMLRNFCITLVAAALLGLGITALNSTTASAHNEPGGPGEWRYYCDQNPYDPRCGRRAPHEGEWREHHRHRDER
jgi:hypothetical protein